jgi:hypothetical protein
VQPPRRCDDHQPKQNQPENHASKPDGEPQPFSSRGLHRLDRRSGGGGADILYPWCELRHQRSESCLVHAVNGAGPN